MVQAFWLAAAKLMSDHLRTDHAMDWFTRIQALRGDLEDLQSACLHFLGLPSRRDVIRLQRRLVSLHKRMADLDRALAEAERAARRRSGYSPPGTRNDT